MAADELITLDNLVLSDEIPEVFQEIYGKDKQLQQAKEWSGL